MTSEASAEVSTQDATTGVPWLKRNAFAVVAVVFASVFAVSIWSAFQEPRDNSLPSASMVGKRANAASTDHKGLIRTTIKGQQNGVPDHYQTLGGSSFTGSRTINFDKFGSVTTDAGRVATQANGASDSERIIDHKARTVKDGVGFTGDYSISSFGVPTRSDWEDGAIIGKEVVNGSPTYHWQKRSLGSTEDVWVSVDAGQTVRTSYKSTGVQFVYDYSYEPFVSHGQFLPDVPPGYQHINPLPACRADQKKGFGCA